MRLQALSRTFHALSQVGVGGCGTPTGGGAEEAYILRTSCEKEVEGLRIGRGVVPERERVRACTEGEGSPMTEGVPG